MWRRYLLPWSGAPKDAEHPLATSQAPALYRATVRRAHYKVHNIADVRHNAWQMLLEGCPTNAVAKRLQGWRVFMHVGDVPDLGLPELGDHAAHDVVSTAQHACLNTDSTKYEVDAQMLQCLDAEEIRDFRVYVLGLPTGKPEEPHSGDSPHSNSNHNVAASGTKGVYRSSGDTDSPQATEREHSIEEGVASRVSFEPETPGWLQGASCIGRITDIYRNESRFYDTGNYIDALGYRELPGECGVFRVAFRKNLVLHAFDTAVQDEATCKEAAGGYRGERFVNVDSLQESELLHVRPLLPGYKGTVPW